MTSERPTTKKRFQGWELNGRGKIRGIWPFPPELQPDVCAELEFDHKQVIISSTEWSEGNPDKPLVRAFNYDKMGRLEFQEWVDHANNISGRNNYEYDKRGLLIKRGEVDPKGKPRFSMEVTCDEQGRFTEQKVYDHLKRPSQRAVYHYDASGRLVKEESFVGGKAFDKLKGFHAYQHDDKGRIVRRSFHGPDGKELSAWAYSYDQYDRRVEMAIEENGARTMLRRMTYDPSGKLASVKILDGEGKQLSAPDEGQAPPTANEIATAVAGGRQALATVAKQDPKALERLSHVAYAQFEAGRYDDARKIYESLAMIEPGNPYYLAGVAAVALQQDQPQAALNYYERALMREPKHLPSLVGKGDALLRLGKVEAALASFEIAFKNAPSMDDPIIRRARGIVTAIVQGQTQKG